ncbi:hypothetical protein D3C85_1259520 [compost metagenome]
MPLYRFGLAGKPPASEAPEAFVPVWLIPITLYCTLLRPGVLCTALSPTYHTVRLVLVMFRLVLLFGGVPAARGAHSPKYTPLPTARVVPLASATWPITKPPNCGANDRVVICRTLLMANLAVPLAAEAFHTWATLIGKAGMPISAGFRMVPLPRAAIAVFEPLIGPPARSIRLLAPFNATPELPPPNMLWFDAPTATPAALELPPCTYGEAANAVPLPTNAMIVRAKVDFFIFASS